MQTKETIVKFFSPLVLLFFMLATVGFDVHYSSCGSVDVVLLYEATDCSLIHPQENCHEHHPCNCVDESHQLTDCGPISTSLHLNSPVLPVQAFALPVQTSYSAVLQSFSKIRDFSCRSPHSLPLRI